MSEDKQSFFLFYGLVMGILVGAWGNLWADAIFEYVVKGDKSDAMAMAVVVTTTILIIIIAILLIWAYSFYKKTQKQPSKNKT